MNLQALRLDRKQSKVDQAQQDQFKLKSLKSESPKIPKNEFVRQNSINKIKQFKESSNLFKLDKIEENRNKKDSIDKKNFINAKIDIKLPITNDKLIRSNQKNKTSKHETPRMWSQQKQNNIDQIFNYKTKINERQFTPKKSVIKILQVNEENNQQEIDIFNPNNKSQIKNKTKQHQLKEEDNTIQLNNDKPFKAEKQNQIQNIILIGFDKEKEKIKKLPFQELEPIVKENKRFKLKLAKVNHFNKNLEKHIKPNPQDISNAVEDIWSHLVEQQVKLVQDKKSQQKLVVNNFIQPQNLQICDENIDEIEENVTLIMNTDIKLGEQLGEGAYSKVFKGMIGKTGNFIAVKKIKMHDIHDKKFSQQMKNLQNEIQILKLLKHQNIVQYFGCEKQIDNFYIYMEHMQGGSLASMLKQYGQFDEQLIKKFVKQIINGLDYLHSKKVIHRDIKGGNILSDGQGQIKLADFGASKYFETIPKLSQSDSELNHSIKGSLYWMAPELLNQEKCGRKVDIWSLGCTVIEMATANHPWPKCNNIASLIMDVMTKKCPDIPEFLSKNCQDFIRYCCQYDKKLRPKASQLKNHPFLIDEIEFPQLLFIELKPIDIDQDPYIQQNLYQETTQDNNFQDYQQFKQYPLISYNIAT